MIQIQNPNQFKTAAERLSKERMKVRRAEPHMWQVVNTAKNHTYHVRFTRTASGLFASCDCPAGLRHNRAPMMCKHVAAAVMVVRGIRDARRQADASAAFGSALDGND